MYNLGQALALIVDENHKEPVINLGFVSKDKLYWVAKLVKENGKNKLAPISIEENEFTIIEDSPHNHKKLKNLPLVNCVYKGSCSTNRVQGVFSKEYIQKNEALFKKELLKLKKRKLFVIF
jgi:hypothetical protein